MCVAKCEECGMPLFACSCKDEEERDDFDDDGNLTNGESRVLK
jgi:hypothetical protein